MSDIPDGVDYTTAQIAIAWEMVKISFDGQVGFSRLSDEDRVKRMLALYAKAIQGVQNPSKVDQSVE